MAVFFPRHSEAAGERPAPPSLVGDRLNESHQGSFKVTWEPPPGATSGQFEVVVARDERFDHSERVYLGVERSSFLSGLDDGTYYFRARYRAQEGAAWSAWSAPQQLEVQHWSEQQALGLMSLGALVFAATVALVLIGQRNVESAA